jgi:hypothetical protein
MQENNYFIIALNVTVNKNNRKFNDNRIIVKLIDIPKRSNDNIFVAKLNSGASVSPSLTYMRDIFAPSKKIFIMKISIINA